MAAAGARFETYVREAMQEAGIPSLAQLARDTGIAASAWHGWFRGVRQPRRNSLKLASDVLSRTPEQLAAVWEGERPQRVGRPQTDPVVAAIQAQTVRLEAVLRELLAPPEPEPTPDRLHRALEAIEQAEDAAQQEQPRSASPRRRRARDRRASEPR